MLAAVSIRFGRSAVGAAAGAGLLAGALAGVLEGVWLIHLGAYWRDNYDVLVIGPLAYGVLGCLAGAVVGVALVQLGLAARNDPVDMFRSSFGIVVAAFVLIVFRFLYARDIGSGAPLGISGWLSWAAASAGVLWLSRFGFGRLLRSPSSRITGLRCVIAWMLLLGLAAAAARALPRASTAQLRPQPSASRPNILYIMVDTLRVDALSVYAKDAGPTLAAARLAADGVVFEQAIAQAPWTRPSVATQITSLPPHRHGARFKSSSIATDTIPLSQVLADAGYYCIGIYNNVHLAPQWGFGRGFHRYFRLQDRWDRELSVLRLLARQWHRLRGVSLKPEDLYGPAQEVFGRARDEWGQAPKETPIFAFVHLMDVHDPYFPRSPAGPPLLRGPHAIGPQREIMQRAYRDGVEHADAGLGAFLQWLRASGRYDDTLIVLVSDHGEEFFEHGGYWHGFTLYEEQIHVPLIVKLPHSRLAGQRQSALVRLLDVAPTIATIAGVALPEQWHGVPLIQDGRLVDPRLPYALSETDLEGRSQRALRGPTLKLIRTEATAPYSLLFDLAADPGERVNLALEPGRGVDVLTAALTRERDGDLWR